MIHAAISTLAEYAGLGAAVLHHAAPERHRPRVSRALHRLGDHPVTRWPAAFALAAVGAGWAAARWRRDRRGARCGRW
jgi:hypothetical protein